MEHIRKFLTKNAYLLIFFAIIIVVRTLFTNQIWTATCTTGADEIGTIASGAWFAGYDWSEIISTNSGYYGFGYSILAAPFYKIFEDPVMIHHAMLFLNNVLIAIIGVLCCIVLVRFLHLKNKMVAILIAGIVIWYTDVGFHGNQFVNETMLYLLCWLTIFLLFLLNENKNAERSRSQTIKNIVYTLLLCGVLFYSLLVHSRSLVMVVTTVITIVCISLITRKSIVNVFVFYPVLVIGYFLSRYCIWSVQSGLWRAGEDADTLTNSTESLTSQLTENIHLLFSFEGIKAWLIELLGQIYAMVVLSYGLAVVALFGICFFLIKIVKNRNIRKMNVKCQNTLVIITFSGVGLLATLVSTSIVALPGVISSLDDDMLNKWCLYHRYWSIYLVIFMLTGCYLLYQYGKVRKRVLILSFLLSCVILLGFSVCICGKYDWSDTMSGIFLPFYSIGFWLLGELPSVTFFRWISLLVIIVFAVFCVLAAKKKMRLGFLIIALLMFSNYGCLTVEKNIRVSEELYAQFHEIVDIVKSIDDDVECVYIETNSSITRLYCQLLLPRYGLTTEYDGSDNTIMIANDISCIGEDGWYLVYSDDDAEYFYDQIYLLVKGEEIADDLAGKGYSLTEVTELPSDMY